MALNQLSKVTIIFFAFTTIICWGTTKHRQIIVHSKKINSFTQKIFVRFSLQKNDFIYKDYIHFSVAHPDVVISPWKIDVPAMNYYDPLFKNTKQILPNKCTLSVIISVPDYLKEPTFLYFTYYQRSEKKINILKYQLNFTDQSITEQDNNIITHLDTNYSPEKNKHCLSLFNEYVTYLHVETLSITYGMQLFCIALLLLLCIIPPYFFTKQLQTSIQLMELLNIIKITSYCLLIGYCLYHLQEYVSTKLLLVCSTVCTFTLGLLYVKKSTKLQWNYLRTLCNLIGMGLIASTVLCLFKTIQSFIAVF